MERKYLGMPKNVCFGLGYLLADFVAIITLILFIVDKGLDKDEKRMCVDTFVLFVIEFVVGMICTYIPFGGLINAVIGLALFVLIIIAAVKRFQGDFAWKLPVISDISASIIK
jgi:uncharacterized membrane protein